MKIKSKKAEKIYDFDRSRSSWWAQWKSIKIMKSLISMNDCTQCPYGRKLATNSITSIRHDECTIFFLNMYYSHAAFILKMNIYAKYWEYFFPKECNTDAYCSTIIYNSNSNRSKPTYITVVCVFVSLIAWACIICFIWCRDVENIAQHIV